MEARIRTEAIRMTATEWIEEWLKEFPDDKFLIEQRLRKDMGKTDEDIKSFLESFA